VTSALCRAEFGPRQAGAQTFLLLDHCLAEEKNRILRYGSAPKKTADTKKNFPFGGFFPLFFFHFFFSGTLPERPCRHDAWSGRSSSGVTFHISRHGDR